MDRRATIAVLVLVVTAGCNGLPAEPTAAPETGTLTPAPVATETATGTEAGAGTERGPANGSPVPSDGLPPGISSNGSVAVERLAAAHEAASPASSYTWTVSYNRTNLATGFVRADYTTRVRVGDGGRYLVEKTSHKPRGVNRTVYVDGPGGYLQLTLQNRSTVRYVPNPVDSDGAVEAASFLERTLRVPGSNLATVRRDGRTYYRLYARQPPPELVDVHRAASVDNYSATAYVTPAGFVRALAVTYEFTARDQRTRVAVRFDYGAVGTTTVPEPDWVERARNDSLPPHPPQTRAS